MQFQSGDIFACYGADFVARAISLETSLTSLITGPPGLRWSPSHVAISSGIDEDSLSQQVWFESTTFCTRKCLVQDRVVQGVQVHEHQSRIDDYLAAGGYVDVWRLVYVDKLSESHQKSLTRTLRKFIGATYDMSGAALSGTRVIKWLPFQRANLHRLFCSELISAVLQRICVMNRENPSVFNPGSLLRELVRHGTYQRVAKIR